MYEAVAITRYKSTCSQEAIELAAQGDPSQSEKELRDKYEEFLMEKVEQLITDNDRLLTPETKDLVARSMLYAQYDLDPKPNSRLKLLYRVPFETIFNLPDERIGSDDGEDDT